MQSAPTPSLDQPRSLTRPDPIAVNRRPQRVVMVIWIAVIASFATMLADLRARENQLDFSHYYTSAIALRAGQNPYTSDLAPYARRTGLDIGGINHADYPPTFLLCSEALTLFPAPLAYWVWIAASVAALAAVLFLLLSELVRRDAQMAWMLAALALMFPPIRENFQYAQCQIVILLMIVLAARWLSAGKDGPAGTMLAFATLLRVFPGLLAGYLIARRRWRALGYMAIGLAIGTAATIVLVGRHTSMGFVTRLGFLTKDNWIYRPANIALSSFVSRLFVYSFGFPFSARVDLVRRSLVSVLRLAVLALTAWATKSKADERDPDHRALSLWIVTMILLSPTAWFHYLVLLLIPLIEVISAARFECASRRAAATAAASYALAFAAYGFVLIGMALQSSLAPLVKHALDEAGFASAVIAYLAAWWFVRDPLNLGPDGSVCPPLHARYAPTQRAACCGAAL